MREDGCSYTFRTREEARICEKGVIKLRCKQLHTPRRGHELSDPTQSFLNAHVEMTPLTSSDIVYRFSDTGVPLQGNYDKPLRDIPPPTPLPQWRGVWGR